MSIDWSKLKPYKRTKQKSFEQLCYQIATREFEHLGVFTSIDDSGGGDGVEFYFSLPNKEIWGWQAKYYEGSVRLNESGRKVQIIKSFRKAIEIHPNLTKWYLCLPMDLTTGEKEWVDKELVKLIPAGQLIDIIIWDETSIHSKLNNPKFNGIRSAFFNDIELSPEWFAQAFENSFSTVRNKFDELLYVPNISFESTYIHPLLCSKEFKDETLLNAHGVLTKDVQDSLKEIAELVYRSQNGKKKFLVNGVIYEGVQWMIEELLTKLGKEINELTPNKLCHFSVAEWDKGLSLLESSCDEIITELNSWKTTNKKNSEQSTDKDDEDFEHHIQAISYSFNSLQRQWKAIVQSINQTLTNKICHILGNGGNGKTNLAVGLARKFINSNWPAVFVPAIKFTGDAPLYEQILTILDIKSNYSFGELLDHLNELGKIQDVRVPIILDGLNEALNSKGHLNERLALDLPHIESEIQRRSHIVLLTTCRITYKEVIWPESMEHDLGFGVIYGFDNFDDKKKLVRQYFDYYKIQADLFFHSLEAFTKPLYLKIFCQCTNPERKKLKQVTLGVDSIYDIFDSFIDQCNKNIFKGIRRAGVLPPIPRYKTVVSDLLEKLAGHLWLHPSRHLQLEDIMSFAGESSSTNNFNNTITKCLLDEELLFMRDWDGKGETVYLTYDLMAGHLIAKYLINNTTDYKSLFEGENAKLLFADDFGLLHPNHEDIVEGLCSLLPIMHGVFAHRLFSDDSLGNDLLSRIRTKSVEATIALSPKYIPNNEVEFIKHLTGRKENMMRLLHLSKGVMFTIDHPFNFNFWQSILEGMTMGDRDIIWSEYLRQLSPVFIDEVNSELYHLLRLELFSAEQIDKLALVTNFLLWTFTSTKNQLKKLSGQSLYNIGIRFPSVLFDKFCYAAQINDPQILEWAIVVLYNIVVDFVKSRKPENLLFFEKIIQFLSTEILTSGGRYATNNIVIRNYAFDTLKLLKRKLPDLCSSLDVKNLQKNFAKIGIVKWRESPDLDHEHYRDGNSLIDYYFHKHKMPHIAGGRGDEYNPTREYEGVQAKLRWRAYNLGYKFSLFEEVDKVIAKQKHYGEEFAETERYADKYITICYNEYSGYLESRNELKHYDKTDYARTFKPFYDPIIPKELEEGFLPEQRFVVEDFIDTTASVKEWCTNIEVPDFSKYLFRKEFLGKSGDWVLIFGLVHQKKAQFERQFYFQANPVFVKKQDVPKAHKAFEPIGKLGKGTQSIPSTENVHASEIPDGEAIPYNEFISWNYKFGQKAIKRRYLKIDLQRGGIKIAEKEAEILWKAILKQSGYQYFSRESVAAVKLPAIKIHEPGNIAPGKVYTIEQVAKKLGIELVENSILRTESTGTFKIIKVMHPVRFLKQKAFLCKNIIDHLNLSTKPGGTDLFDQNGQLASFQYSYEKEFTEQENFTYIRRDLIEKYLMENGLAMFLINWGERDYYPKNGDWMSKNDNNNYFRSSDYFYQATLYAPQPTKT